MGIDVKDKIILGTVQLGIPYGINNSTGKPSEKEAFDILNLAFDNNIRVLDSADAYGDVLDVIGNYQNSSGRQFEVINKFIIDQIPLKQKLDNCLTLLNTSRLYCYMYHKFDDYQSHQVRRDLLNFKTSGLIKKIGLSLYSSDQLKEVLEDKDIDIIQLPVNILDLDDEKIILLQEAKLKGKEIHARSIFLQGLLLKDPDSLVGNLIPMKPYLRTLKKESTKLGLTLKEICFNYILNKDFVDKIVLGVEMAEQLNENLKLIKPLFAESSIERIQIATKDQYLLNPTNWKA